MIIEKFDENKIVFAYNEWNKKDVDDDNYYVIAYLELYPTRLVLKYRSAKISGDNRWGCVGNFEEDDEHKKIVFTVGRCIDNIDSNLYYSDHVIMDFVAKKIARYDMVCMPFKKRIWMDTAEAIRVKHIAKCSHKKFCKVYANAIEIANDLCRMDKYEKAFFSVGGKANYENFVSRNNDVVPDFYLGKDILKYRAASLAFMNVAGNHSQNKIEISCPIGESHTRIIMPTKWNWREHMVINVDHISSGTNRFLDRYPGCVPLNMKLAFNTSREPSRLFLIAQDVLRKWNRHIDYPDLAFKILERSSDKQIRKALSLLGLNNTRKSAKVSDALSIIFDYDPLNYNCTIVGWARNSIEAHRQENLQSLEEKLAPYKETDILAPKFPVDFSEYGIRQLMTPEEIIMEGHEMKHCVGTYVKRVLGGFSYIFAFNNGEERATAEINQFGEVVQVRGIQNRSNQATTEMYTTLKNKIAVAIEKKEFEPAKRREYSREIGF